MASSVLRRRFAVPAWFDGRSAMHHAGAIALALLVQTASAATTTQATMAPVDVTRTEIAPGVHQFTVASDGYVEHLNSVAIITNEGVVVFDTTTRPSTARTILADLRKLTTKPVRYVVNSHWHPDHWSGNQVFAEAFPAIEIIATEQERELMLNMSPSWRVTLPRAVDAQAKLVAEQAATGLVAPGVPLTDERRGADELDLARSRDMLAEQLAAKRVYPTLTYTGRLTLHYGGREFRFISTTGDAAATTVLLLPKERILITGDVVSWPLPYYTPPLSQHAKSIRELASLDAEIIVPGHGPAFRDKTYMTLQAELFEAIVKQVRDALRAGQVAVDDVQRAVDVESFRERFARGDAAIGEAFPAFVRGMARRAWIELRDGKDR